MTNDIFVWIEHTENQADSIAWEASLPELREVQCEFIAGTPAEQAAALVTKLLEQKIL